MQLDCEELKLQSLIEYFYAIPGVPTMAVKPQQLNSGLRHHKIFIQSTSQGSRCLKAGTKILYLKEVLCTLNFHTSELCKHNIICPLHVMPNNIIYMILIVI